VRAVAIMCARNEEVHIRSALTDLIAEGLDVVLIDHESGDATVPIAREFIGRGLLGIERLPWTGRFSLIEQLEAKQRVINLLDHDWIVHVDADEWLCSPDSGRTLLDGLRAADAFGYNCVNFNEYVLLPRPGENLYGDDYRKRATRYYFYQDKYPNLQRAWKHHSGLENVTHAGHLLSGPVRMFPREFLLRHYIFLSEAHAERKYLSRSFDEDEVARGWHHDRLIATMQNLEFPDNERMRTLPRWSSKQFDESEPLPEHYWEWTRPSSEYAADSA
jgi:glycosyltransferase involved in cell wall biosynthesis